MPVPPPTRAFLDRAAGGRHERSVRRARPDVEAVDVVEEPVPGLADDGQAPVELAGAVARSRDQRVADDADLVRVREPDRRRQHPGVADPLEPGQLAVAVDRVRSRRRAARRRRDDTVTPVRTVASPSISVVWPTRTPGTSVIAFAGPGGACRSRSRGRGRAAARREPSRRTCPSRRCRSRPWSSSARRRSPQPPTTSFPSMPCSRWPSIGQ